MMPAAPLSAKQELASWPLCASERNATAAPDKALQACHAASPHVLERQQHHMHWSHGITQCYGAPASPHALELQQPHMHWS